MARDKKAYYIQTFEYILLLHMTVFLPKGLNIIALALRLAIVQRIDLLPIAAHSRCVLHLDYKITTICF